MSHDRKPHTRRYPIRADGTRRPGRVSVNGAHVNESDGDDGGGGCCCCLVVIIILLAGGLQSCHWAANIL